MNVIEQILRDVAHLRRAIIDNAQLDICFKCSRIIVGAKNVHAVCTRHAGVQGVCKECLDFLYPGGQE